MTIIDLVFPVRGDTLPMDHAYPLYGALSRAVPEFHREESPVRFLPVNGDVGGPGLMKLFGKSRLRVRLNAELIATLLPLTGQRLQVGDHAVTLGAPTVEQLTPAVSLNAGFVTFKNSVEPGRFLEVAKEKLADLGIKEAGVGIPLVQKGKSAGEPRRRVIRVKGATIVGFPLIVEGLTADESIRLQEQGLGGRTKIGCGFFVPFVRSEMR